MNTVMTELNTMAFEGRRDFLAQICDKDLLVLDDLGSEPETSYCNQIFIQIVNNCLTRNVPLLFTSAFHEDILTKEGSNAKRAMAITRLLKRNISYTVLMPGERRNTNLEQKRKAVALVKGGTLARQETMEGFEGPEAACGETAVTECLPQTVQQSLPQTVQPSLPLN